MNILFSINDNYIEQIKVLIYSILAHNRDVKIIFYFIDGDLSEISKKIIQECVGDGKAEVRFVQIDNQMFAKAPKRKNISVETYYRLLAFELLPEVNKVLYLDADILVTGSLKRLYNKDISKVCIAGVLDQGEVQKDKKHKIQLGLNPNSNYINAGVLLMNLERIRKIKTKEEIFDFITKKQQKLKYQDQDIINAIYSDEIMLIETKYNQSPLYNSLDDFKKYYSKKRRYPVIIHYMGEKTKPWNEKKYGYKYLRIYYAYCKMAGASKLLKKLILPMVLRPLAIVEQFEKECELERCYEE